MNTEPFDNDPNSAQAYYNLGNLLAELNRPEEAEAAFRGAIEKDPNDAAAYSNLGWLLKNLNRPEEAEAAFRQAIAKDPDLALAYSNLGLLLRKLKRLEEAEGVYRQAIEKDPNDAAAYSNLGVLLRSQNRFEEALSLFEKSHTLFPRSFTALHIAGTYKQCGKEDLLGKLVDEALRFVEKHDLYDLACMESLLGNLEAAFEHLRSAAEVPEFDRSWAWQDPDLEALRGESLFEQIVGPRL